MRLVGSSRSLTCSYNMNMFFFRNVQSLVQCAPSKSTESCLTLSTTSDFDIVWLEFSPDCGTRIADCSSGASDYGVCNQARQTHSGARQPQPHFGMKNPATREKDNPSMFGLVGISVCTGFLFMIGASWCILNGQNLTELAYYQPCTRSRDTSGILRQDRGIAFLRPLGSGCMVKTLR